MLPQPAYCPPGGKKNSLWVVILFVTCTGIGPPSLLFLWEYIAPKIFLAKRCPSHYLICSLQTLLYSLGVLFVGFRCISTSCLLSTFSRQHRWVMQQSLLWGRWPGALLCSGKAWSPGFPASDWAGGPALAMAAQCKTSALSSLYSGSHQPGLEFLRTTLQSKALPSQSSFFAPLLHGVRLALEPPPLSCSFHFFKI